MQTLPKLPKGYSKDQNSPANHRCLLFSLFLLIHANFSWYDIACRMLYDSVCNVAWHATQASRTPWNLLSGYSLLGMARKNIEAVSYCDTTHSFVLVACIFLGIREWRWIFWNTVRWENIIRLLHVCFWRYLKKYSNLQILV